jgi:predicted DNA-binding transcriptional regulator AlpA
MNPSENTPMFITVRELALRWRLSRQRIYQLKDHGALPYYVLAGSLRFRLDEIEAYELHARSTEDLMAGGDEHVPLD